MELHPLLLKDLSEAHDALTKGLRTALDTQDFATAHVIVNLLTDFAVILP